MVNIVWDDEAKKQLKQAYLYIRKDSLQNADKVRRDIISTVTKILNNPQKHSPDKYKINNDGSYRAFELHRYRISYHVGTDPIRILRIRHTSMNPLDY